ncbi:MAG: hydrogenase iron-sulfur subunit [Acidobacteriota bacterium]|nr:hydrogenase iron-sulfur subunit [Acidobacteriota bacterium]
MVFACNHTAAPYPSAEQLAISVPCLARVDESLIVAAAASGATGIFLDESACSTCSHKAVLAIARESVASANAILSAWSSVPQACLTALDNPAPVAAKRAQSAASPVTRRTFFRALRGEACATAASALAGSAQNNASAQPLAGGVHAHPREVPARHQLLIECLHRLGPSTAGGAYTFLNDRVRIGGECTGCHACVDFCSTGALIVCRDGDLQAVAHQPARCTRCHLCEDICHQAMQSGALSLLHSGTIEESISRDPEILITRQVQASHGETHDRPWGGLEALLDTSLDTYNAAAE